MHRHFASFRYIYLHGFCSSPYSHKAEYFRQSLAQRGIDLYTPDLNAPDFFSLTLTRQLHTLSTELLASPVPLRIIGSSFGALTAAWLKQRCSKVEKIVLLAPAFGLTEYIQQSLGAAELERWQKQGSRNFWHYGFEGERALSYAFYPDLLRYDEDELQLCTDTLMVHGTGDAVIDIARVRHIAQCSPCEYRELPDDHGLLRSLPLISDQVDSFFGFCP